VSYVAYTVKTNFGCSGKSEYGPTSNSLVDRITLPDGSFYQFHYEPTPGFTGDVTGTIGLSYPAHGWNDLLHLHGRQQRAHYLYRWKHVWTYAGDSRRDLDLRAHRGNRCGLHDHRHRSPERQDDNPVSGNLRNATAS